jgi:hypothetical protein
MSIGGKANGPAAQKMLASKWHEQQTRKGAKAAQALQEAAVNVRVLDGASEQDARAVVAAAAASGAIDSDLLSGKKAPGSPQYTPPGSPNSPPGSPQYTPPGSPNSPPGSPQYRSMSLPQCLERAACQLRSGEGCAQELPKAASWKPVSKFTPGARAPRVAASPGCEEKDDQAAWPFSGFHV